MENKYLIILGGHNGSIVRQFREDSRYKDFFFYVFEPNPIYKNDYVGIKDMELIQSAAWIDDGEIRFYIGNKKFQGHSVMEKKKNIDVNSHIDVPCVDFSQWVLDNFDENDCLHMRIDIEGAEYDVLTKMIGDNSIDLFEKIYVEFHHYKYPELDTENRYKTIVESVPDNIFYEI